MSYNEKKCSIFKLDQSSILNFGRKARPIHLQMKVFKKSFKKISKFRKNDERLSQIGPGSSGDSEQKHWRQRATANWKKVLMRLIILIINFKGAPIKQFNPLFYVLVGREYSLADRRYVDAEPNTVLVEILTVFFGAILALFVIEAILNPRWYRHYLQICVCIAYLYGGKNFFWVINRAKKISVDFDFLIGRQNGRFISFFNVFPHKPPTDLSPSIIHNIWAIGCVVFNSRNDHQIDIPWKKTWWWAFIGEGYITMNVCINWPSCKPLFVLQATWFWRLPDSSVI